MASAATLMILCAAARPLPNDAARASVICVTSRIVGVGAEGLRVLWFRLVVADESGHQGGVSGRSWRSQKYISSSSQKLYSHSSCILFLFLLFSSSEL